MRYTYKSLQAAPQTDSEEIVIVGSPHGPLMERAGFAAQLQFDPESRTIYILEGITEDLLQRFLPTFQVLDSTDGDINIVMSSPGGCVSEGLAIHAAIASARNKVTITCMGYAYSMAAIILQAADERVLEENCRFMIHDGSGGVQGELGVLFSATTELSKTHSTALKILAQRSGLTLEKVRDLSRAETYLSAREAAKLGFVDKVLKHRKKVK